MTENLASLVVFAVALAGSALIARTQSKVVTLLDPLVLALIVCGIAVLSVRVNSTTLTIGVTLALACTIVAAASDLATGLVFDVTTGGVALAILSWSILEHRSAPVLLWAAICGMTILFLYGATLGRGIGLGDAKLCAVIGAGFAGPAAIVAIGAAFVLGAVWACTMLARCRVRRGERVAFAPFLAVGSIVAVALGGPHINA